MAELHECCNREAAPPSFSNDLEHEVFSKFALSTLRLKYDILLAKYRFFIMDSASSDDIEWVVVDYPDEDYGRRLKQAATTQRPHTLHGLTYKPLDFPSWETRFIKIHQVEPGHYHSSPVSCDLFHGSLINAGNDYVALSYCWGVHRVTRGIYVNGILRNVTTNLEAALRALRESGIQQVWIDAVCMNQSDNYERSYQVSRMGSIYSQASKLVVWLGNSEDDSDKAMQLLATLSSRGVPENLREPIHNFRAPIACLLMRPYWQRVWIVQSLLKRQR